MNHSKNYNIIRVYNKDTNESYILIGLNAEHKTRELAKELGEKFHFKNVVLQKEFTEYKKKIKRSLIKDKYYKYIDYNLLTFDTHYSYEVLEQIEGLDFNAADKHILHYRELRQGYNQYTYKENAEYYNFKEEQGYKHK